MKGMIGVLAVIFLMLAGCDQVHEVMAEQRKPNVMLGAGAQVQIGEKKTAKVFGPDQCETGFEDDDTSDDVRGCTLLTGNDKVQVTLVFDGVKLKETWTVITDNDRYTLVRPNGYLIRDARTIN
ncbi:hypothetical protein [Marinobacter salarius]|uniref:Lipoprotein n=1 Tax=Marinobacter salarius TaxID=1420917 RepID=A0A1W6KFT4_9GAMM|nr:hypothetical protein [Marinobacter salarius]ARM86261.1 hypothetical protein MARSALSMR5_04244 [Marinobacter salarius]